MQGQELTDEVLLNPKNYYNKWYRPEAKDISDIVQKLTNNGNHPEITNIKHSYDRFCAYKHYTPYVMMPRYGTSMNIPNCDEFLAISISLQCLYIIILSFLLVMLVLEAFLTAPYLNYDIIVVYTAVITTLCCLLIGLFFITYSKWLYTFLFITVGAFLYLYYFDARISLAHQQERCLDLGWVWDKKQGRR